MLVFVLLCVVGFIVGWMGVEFVKKEIQKEVSRQVTEVAERQVSMKVPQQLVKRQSHSKKTHHIEEILPYLYLGDRYSAYEINEGKNPHGITTMINVAEELKDLVSKSEAVLVHFPFQDDYEPLFEMKLKEICPIIEKAKLSDGKEKVLVFCKHGARRSVSTVLAYLIWSGHNKTFREALEFLSKQYSLKIRLSPIFVKQLEKIEPREV